MNVTWEPNSLRVKIAVDAQCALTITAICHGTASAKSVELFNARTGELLRRKTFCPGVSDGDATYAFEFSNSVGAAFDIYLAGWLSADCASGQWQPCFAMKETAKTATAATELLIGALPDVIEVQIDETAAFDTVSPAETINTGQGIIIVVDKTEPLAVG